MPLRSFDGGPQHSEAKILILLSNRIRRRTIEILREDGVELTVSDLANRIASDRSESPSADALARVRAELCDEHLPKLDAADVIEFDATDGTVRRGLTFDAYDDFIGSITDDDLPWSES